MAFQFVILRGRSDVKVHRLGPGVTVAGRQEGCQLQVKASLVSRRHCEFFERDGVLYVKDLNSSNGTFVNNEKVDGERALQPGDEISIGGVKFRVERVDAAPSAGVATMPPVSITAPDSDGAIPFERDDDETVMLTPEKKAAVGAVSATTTSSASEEEAIELEGSPNGPELGEDAVADFLLDLEVEEDDESK